MTTAEAPSLLDRWLSQARCCRTPVFGEPSHMVRCKREGILRSVESDFSNANVKTVNNKMRVTIRQGHGFLNIDNLIALVMLRCSDPRQSLPSRTGAWPLSASTCETSNNMRVN